MDQQHGSDPARDPGRPAGPDPSLWRGLTQPRLSQQGPSQHGLSRRQVLRGAGAGAGAVGIGAFLAACGVKGATTTSSGSAAAGATGTAAWWAKQKLHHTVNFANWPYYIDVLKGKHLSLEHFTQQTGIQVTYTEPINDNLPFYAKIRPSLTAKQPTGYDIIVMTNSSPPLGYLISFGWLTPLDRSMMPNFEKYAGPLIKNPSWDRATSTRWPGSPAGPRSGTTPRWSRTPAPAWASCSTRSTRARSA
jgi:spermidine/putrescine transport system substrate-binding protein